MKKYTNYPKNINLFNEILKIKNRKKRNILRGALTKEYLIPQEIQNIREGNIHLDNLIIGAIVKGKNGLRTNQGSKNKPTSESIYRITSLKPLESQQEVLYTLGYINSMEVEACDCISSFNTLAQIENYAAVDALDKISSVSSKYGASNYISYKLSYIKSTREIDQLSQKLIEKIEEDIHHKESAGFHFSALENLSSKVSLFLVAKRRMAGLKGTINENFRSSVSLSNFIPTPITTEDIAPFLLRATENSLIDSIYSIIILLNLEERYPDIAELIKNYLSPKILGSMIELINLSHFDDSDKVLTSYYHSQNPDSTKSLDVYRISSAFLERRSFCIYRNNLDSVIGRRLLSNIIYYPKIRSTDTKEKNILFEESADFRIGSFPSLREGMDSFYRTYLFLKFISSRSNMLSFDKDEVKFVFENTMGLEYLLTENEVRSLYLTAPKNSKGLITVLSLALHRGKSADPDIDFEFRDKFIQYVNQQHKGSIEEFISELLNGTPEVANYIVGSLDEVTLEKLYTLVENASKAADIRREILKAVGYKLNRIEYLIESDAIATRSKISQLRGYFDTSRMYVDSVAMKKWLDNNPSVFTEQYKDQYPKTVAKLSTLKSKSSISEKEYDLVVVEYLATDVYLVTQMAKDAFEEFCLNNEFGIQSYLGRRIRHNTLHGVMTETVDAIWKKQEHTALMANRYFRKSWGEWLESYKGIVEKLRKERLQFKTNSSLFDYRLEETDPQTQRNIKELAISLRSSAGMELLNDLVIGFCWKQISPQLDGASRFIKTNLLNEATNNINLFFGKYHGNDEERFKHALLEAVNEVFRKVASWFRVPQTGFIPATIEELCRIIAIDLSKSTEEFVLKGEAVHNKFTGISVHRIYDCLAVLLQNAYKHGDQSHPIIIEAESYKVAGAPIENVSIKVKSRTSEDNFSTSVVRIQRSICSDENGSDMINEGYSGLKKLKFITKLNEGHHTVSVSFNKETCEISLGFVLKCERYIEEQQNFERD